ncbi:kinesin-like protein KIF9 isoform X2 [Pomacea canaliculata]|uniref:kinesin-like protein KIF9 isoform X2 n=1 Tax=Pomacea canaliculata TaxID=400727 RepID=UPI000D72937E|nr:kinesin-like protein KIF9 isoform X2 [Pomacea canaliculata]
MSGRANNRNKKVKVWARIRPSSNFAHDNLELLPDKKSINLHLKRDPKKGIVNNQILDWSFKLDGIFHNATQEHVFSTVASNLVTSAIDGYNGTLMCYGQTGAGKTFTITGATENFRHRGLIPRALSQLFKEIEERLEFSIIVRISYMEIYNEVMYDLLASLPDVENPSGKETMVLTENQDGVYVKGLSCHLAQNEEEALNLLFEGETNRTIAAHVLNRMSSRSHCLFTVYLESRSRVHSNAKYTVSKLHFVDLAGSERIGKTKSEGKMQTEALYINKSLTFLEQVVIALADRKREHIPFRQSKLTHYLKDSIGGRCNTVLITNIWSERAQLEETVSSLRFATRMMCVASEPAVNEVCDPAACPFCAETHWKVILVKTLHQEIEHLKSELAMHDTLANRSSVNYDPLSEQQKYEIRQQCRRYLEGTLDEIDIVNLRQIQGTFEAFREIYHQIENDVEDKLRQKFTLSDRADVAAMGGAQQAHMSTADEPNMVGETDGTGFGVGSAPKSAKAEPSAVVQLKKKEREREKKRAARGGSPVGVKVTSSPTQSAKGEQDSKSPLTSVDRDKEEGPTSPVSSAGGAQRPDKSLHPHASNTSSDFPEIGGKWKAEKGIRSHSEMTEEADDEGISAFLTGQDLLVDSELQSPPSRTAAFEEFKQEKGSEINRILIENKEILASKKKAYSDLAKKINNIKLDIDNTRQTLERFRAERDTEGPVFNNDGDIVISEEEFMEVQRLKDLKKTYQIDYEELKTLKTQVQYCQKLVDQCRQKLLNEFDKWYAESFLNLPGEEVQTSVQAGYGPRLGAFLPIIPSAMLEDEEEKFDRLHNALLMNNPDSVSFFNAKMRTERRKIYQAAMSQAQPSYAHHKSGTPTTNVHKKLPNMLQVHY